MAMSFLAFAARTTARLALLVLALGATAAPASPRDWTITLLPGIGNDSAIAEAVNDRGDVVGESFPVDPATGRSGSPRATRWVNGVPRDLGMGEAFDVSARGTIAGTHFPGGESLWKDGEWTALGVGSPGFPLFVNKFDTVASSVPFIGAAIHAYTLRDGVLTDLGTLGGTESQSLAINDRGIVVGFARTAGDAAIHPFKYERGVMTDLGTLGRQQGKAVDVNNHGVIVGYVSDLFDGASAAFIDDGVMRLLFPGRACCSVPSAINDRGDVVGVLDGTQGFLLEDGVLTRLGDLPAVRAAGWTRLLPRAINDRGWIVGMGLTNAPVQEGRVPWRAFLLKRDR
jgi:probable HAF family extracellular repeat protein